LGQLVRIAQDEGAQKIFLCLSGSSTNDAGCGMAAALGFTFLDRDGQRLDPRPAELHRLDRIEPSTRPFGAGVIALTDVQNPLFGPDGASHVYGPQKGASADDVLHLEEAIARVAQIAARDLGAPDPATPGAGAAGELGFDVLAFLGGTLRGGFETIASMTGLAEAVAAADLVITGEGRLDERTPAGKAPAGVARLARAAGKPVIAFAGSVPLTNPPRLRCGNSHHDPTHDTRRIHAASRSPPPRRRCPQRKPRSPRPNFIPKNHGESLSSKKIRPQPSLHLGVGGRTFSNFCFSVPHPSTIDPQLP
jgi:glycerate kinase